MTNSVFMGVLSNTLFASGLALLTLVLARLWRNPHLTHALWLLVLIKLVTPSFVEIPVAKPLAAVQSRLLPGFSDAQTHSTTETQPTSVESTDSTHTRPESSLGQPQPSPPLDAVAFDTVFTARNVTSYLPAFLLSGWFVGTIAFIGVALRRNTKFSRLLAESHPAKADLIDDANRIAKKMGLPVAPPIRTTTACVSPLVTGVWRRAVILLPQQMLDELSRDQIRTVLAHELAHIRRRDQVVQLLKFAILAGHWWNPLAWWASRQLEQSQEECCDAWVVWALPNHRHAYGKTLLQTVEFLTEPRLRPVVSETFMVQCNLERRIEMVLKQTVPQRITRRMIGVALVAGLIVLPTSFTLAIATEPVSKPETTDTAQAAEAISDSTEPSTATAATTADLPYMVEFEQGATRFLDGDEITIKEVRGTAKTFEPGHIYLIRGTYQLASHEKASVAAYTTATKSSDGKSRTWKVQHMSVDRGKGEFALFLPMSYEGWPHVSFYPDGGGEGFGGNYFGTGNYVLKKWWKESGGKSDSTAQVIKLDKVLWTDAPELRQRFGEKVMDSLSFGIVARVEGYNGDWEALKRHQAASGSEFQLQASERPTLRARMHSGGITFGKREAWVLFHVEGRPSAGVDYTLRAPDSNWLVASPALAR